MKKISAMLLSLCLLLCGCASPEPPRSEGLLIVCSDFPAYDFAREIAGEKAELCLLIKPGTEVHSYEPTPRDVVRMESSDLFICNGGESEAWLETLSSGCMNTVRMMDCVETLTEEEKEGMYIRGEDGEEEELDEHVWTSPQNAVLISEEICARLCEIDPGNAELYTANLRAFTAELRELDAELHRVIDNAPHRTLIFADRFPMRYFTREYGLDYFAAFPGCSSESEASAKTVAFLIDRVREEGLSAVLYMEFSNEKLANVICEDTGCSKLPFYSVHNLTAEQFEAGMGYLDLMRINLESLKEALY